MRFDKDLARSILLELEASNDHPDEWKQVQIEGSSEEQIAYTICLLSEGGFLAAENPYDFDWRAKRLTYRGHEFLDTVRDGAVWSRTKAAANAVGSMGMKMLLEIAKGLVKEQIAEHGFRFPQ